MMHKSIPRRSSYLAWVCFLFLVSMVLISRLEKKTQDMHRSKRIPVFFLVNKYSQDSI